jgi:hypothetical protein
MGGDASFLAELDAPGGWVRIWLAFWARFAFNLTGVVFATAKRV